MTHEKQGETTTKGDGGGGGGGGGRGIYHIHIWLCRFIEMISIFRQLNVAQLCGMTEPRPRPTARPIRSGSTFARNQKSGVGE